ncbi:hypothetical protein WMY93_033966 [Mugilogobius chulae]|uniref:Uncharacterized protein n=1 Tax=Mugilogobius chulae TaxID=88201 RepID=A0AAW0MLR9_9GOBI
MRERELRRRVRGREGVRNNIGARERWKEEEGGGEVRERKKGEKKRREVPESVMQAVRVKYKDRQKYICYEGQLSFSSFLECDGFSSPTNSSFASYSGDNEGDSDDTIIIQRSPASVKRMQDASLSHHPKKKPGGDRVLSEYARTKSLTDGRRRDMVNILVAHMTSEHGTRPSRRVKEEYAQGIIALFPNLSDPKSKLGYEHFYSAEGGGTGFLAWRLKFVQKEASDGQKKKSQTPSPKGNLSTTCVALYQGIDKIKMLVLNIFTGGPKADRDPIQDRNESMLTENQCCEAIALMKHTTDEGLIKEKMKQTFHYRQNIIRDPEKSSDIFTMFPRFLDITGIVEQDFRLMFGDATSSKFLEKWPTVYKQKVLKQTRGLTQTSELQDLIQNVESSSEVEEGWDGDMSSILILVHLLPPPPQGRKRPGKLSARQACNHLVRFLKTGPAFKIIWTASRKSSTYLLACGNTKKKEDFQTEFNEDSPNIVMRTEALHLEHCRKIEQNPGLPYVMESDFPLLNTKTNTKTLRLKDCEEKTEATLKLKQKSSTETEKNHEALVLESGPDAVAAETGGGRRFPRRRLPPTRLRGDAQNLVSLF